MAKTVAHQLNIAHLPTSDWKKASEPKKTPKVSAKFLKMVDHLIEKHEDTLRELAER